MKLHILLYFWDSDSCRGSENLSLWRMQWLVGCHSLVDNLTAMHTLATVHWLRGLSIKREDTKLRCIWRSWRGDAGIQIYDYISLNIFAFLKNEKNTKLIWQLYPRWFIFYWVTSCTRWANTIQLFSFLPSRLFFFSMNSEKKMICLFYLH